MATAAAPTGVAPGPHAIVDVAILDVCANAIEPTAEAVFDPSMSMATDPGGAADALAHDGPAAAGSPLWVPDVQMSNTL